jgi:hypothetical protein
MKGRGMNRALSLVLNAANYFSWKSFRHWAELSDMEQGLIDKESFVRPHLEGREGMECPQLKELQTNSRLPTDEWRKPLSKAQSIATRWLASDSLDADALAQHVQAIAFWEMMEASYKRMPKKERIEAIKLRLGGDADRIEKTIELHRKAIGQLVSEAMLSGDVDMIKAAYNLTKRWTGESRKVNLMPVELSVIVRAYLLWRKFRRNPTRAELWAACEAHGIKAGDATNKRGLLQKTGLQFLAKG